MSGPQQTPIAAAAPAVGDAGRDVAPLIVSPGTLEALKWLALVLMTVDHVNKYLLGASVAPMFWAGRVAMPLFVFVSCYHLSRPSALASGVHGRMAKRLAPCAVLASVPYIALGTWVGWWPLNILFLLLAVVAITYLVDRGGNWREFAAVVIFVGAGALAEFFWPAMLLAVALWQWCRHPTTLRLMLVAAALASVGIVNQNLWAMAALPIILAAPDVDADVPRAGRVFYAYYPAHLALIWAIKAAGLP